MMANKNYIKGRAKEYRLKHAYEKRGWIVLRMSGSHGFSDLVAVHKKNKTIKFIQVKPKNFGKLAKGQLEKEWGWLNDEFIGTYTVE